MRIKLILLPFFLLCFLYGALAQESVDSAIWSIDLPEVVTTGQPEPTSSRAALHQIRTLGSESLISRGVTNLEQALQQIVGIRIRQDLILGPGLSLMGLGGQNIQIMIDGVPVIGRLNGQIDLSQINMLDVVRIEVVEGPLAVSYGTNALAGVINVVTRSSQINPIQVTLGAQYESLAENRLEAGLGWQFHEKWLVKANGALDQFSGWKADEESRAYLWNPKDQFMGKVAVIFQPNQDQRLRIEGRHFQEELQLLGEERRPQFKPYAFDQHFSTIRNDIVASFEGGVGDNAYLKATTAYNSYARIKDAYRINFDDDERITMYDDLDTTRFSSWMIRAQIAMPRSNANWKWQAGIDFRGDEGNGERIAGENGALGEARTLTDLAAFAKVGFHGISPLTVQMGLRYGYNSVFDIPLIPSVHLKYAWSENWQWRASYGKGFRSPDLKELYLEFIDINHYILGNPNLTPESANHLQSSVVYNQEKPNTKLKLQALVFYNSVQNRISLFEFMDSPSGPIMAQDTSTGRYTYFNQDQFYSKGARVGLNWQNQYWTADLQAQSTGLYNALHEQDESVSRFTYQWSGTASVQYAWGQKVPMQLQTLAHWQDQIITFYPDTDENGNTVSRQRIQDGLTQIDISGSATFFKKRCQLTIGVRNLLNIQQVTVQGGAVGPHSGGANSAPISPGRSQFVGVRFQIN
ncbi:MAG: TonB-dependent receptor [Saprospiraceae bacterium]|nr:TonB-dependent receptor [Saprospiraceae bacterium]